MQIRDINTDDIPAIVQMLQEMRMESPTYNSCDDNPLYVSEMLSQYLEVGALQGVISDTGFMLAGVGAPWYDARPVATEQVLYVRRAARGGLGAVRLIRALENQVAASGARRLYVGASAGIQDERAELLYEKLGYVREGKHLYKELF